jgi:sugar diacid utilization regulator
MDLRRSLVRYLASGADLETLGERVALFVKKPVCVYGPAGELQAFAQLPQAATVLPFDPPAVLAPATLDGEDDRAVVVGPFPDAGVMHRMMASPVHDHQGQTIGAVTIAEHHGRLHGLDRLAAEAFSDLLTLRDHAAREGVQAREARRADLARDLIFGYGEEAKLVARARDHGIRLGTGGAHLVATIAQRDQLAGMVDLRPEPVERALTRVFRTEQVFVGSADGAVFVLLAGIGEEDKATTDLVRAVLDGVVEELWHPDADVIAALARPCFKAPDFSRARRECERGLEVLRSLGGAAPRRTVSAQELGVLSLAGGGSGRAGAGQFAVDVLGELATPESGELLQTLAAYFDADRSARDAAAALGVHQNTVRYRLGSIAKQTRLDVLGSPGDELMARLAVGILRMQGRLPETSRQDSA